MDDTSTQIQIREVDLSFDDQEVTVVTQCIQSKWLTEGPRTQQLREAIQKDTGSPYVTFAPNGTLGLYLALLALDLPPGSEVIVPSFTFYASATSVVFAGLKPVFVDVKRDTFNLDPALLAEKLSPKTRAIMVVHCYGQSCELDSVMSFAREHNLFVIEDAAQGYGVKYKNQPVGTFGDIGMISFFSDKVITMGEGAALLVREESLFEKVKLMRNQGRPSSGTFIHPELGMNFRITDLHAAIGYEQVKKFPQIVARRRQIWAYYCQQLRGVGDIGLMRIIPESNIVPFRFPFTTQHNKALQQFLQERGIATRGFFYPMHWQPKLKKDPVEHLPNSEALFNTGICLPIHNGLTDADIEYITTTISEFYESLA